MIRPCEKFGPNGCKIVSTKVWKKNEIIENLWGSLAYLPEDSNYPIVPDVNDFSTIDFKGKNYLMLGPIRYVNSSCKPNAEIVEKRSQMVIRLLKKVQPLDEILVNVSCYFVTIDHSFYQFPKKPFLFLFSMESSSLIKIFHVSVNTVRKKWNRYFRHYGHFYLCCSLTISDLTYFFHFFIGKFQQISNPSHVTVEKVDYFY